MPKSPAKSKGIPMGPQESPQLDAYSSPKERFRGLANNVQLHQDMVDSAAFERGADAALVEFVTNLSVCVKDPNSAMDAGFELRGAVKFLKEFKTLAELPKLPTKIRDMDNLQSTEPPRRP